MEFPHPPVQLEGDKTQVQPFSTLQVLLHPSFTFTEFPSSHPSDIVTIPLPQTSRQTVFVLLFVLVQFHPKVMVQLLKHPSVLIVLLSSQVSLPLISPSPQMVEQSPPLLLAVGQLHPD